MRELINARKGTKGNFALYQKENTLSFLKTVSSKTGF